MRILLPLALLAACTDTGEDEPDLGGPVSDDTGDAQLPYDPEQVLTFGIIADPHVTAGSPDHAARLEEVVDAILDEPEDRSPDIVFILGDIAWSGGYDAAYDALDRLTMPWVPVLGDNPIQVGEETGFHDAFSDHLDEVGSTLDGWTRAPIPVDGPEGEELWLQNARLDMGGVRFVALDWNTRVTGSGWGEFPDTHDVEGGTLPFLEESLETLAPGPERRVVLLSHMPFIPGMDLDEQAQVIEVVERFPDAVWGNQAGHFHGNGEAVWEEADLQLRTTDATWDDVNTWRRVEVWSDGVELTYEEELIEL